MDECDFCWWSFIFKDRGVNWESLFGNGFIVCIMTSLLNFRNLYGFLLLNVTMQFSMENYNLFRLFINWTFFYCCLFVNMPYFSHQMINTYTISETVDVMHNNWQAANYPRKNFTHISSPHITMLFTFSFPHVFRAI